MAVAAWDQAEAGLIILNHHGIYITFGGTFAPEKNGICCQRNEKLSFLTDVVHMKQHTKHSRLK